MAVAIPFVGGAVGWLAGGSFGAQIGWMVGAAIYSAVQPAQVISAGNPSTAPSVGSDIRGQTIPVIFGTVRCSGYLVWQKNFKSNKNTRKVGSGKKKSKQEYYSYSWDFMFHMGHATVPYRVVGMWEGSERIQDDSLDNITFADGSEFAPAQKVEQQESLIAAIGGNTFWSFAISALRFRQLQSAQAAKSLTWAEAYFYGAHASSDAENGWTYFQNQETAPNIRWPHSVWMGFKQLQLGEQPRIPQLNFEVTPDQEPDMNAAYEGTAVSQEWNSGNAANNQRQRTPVGVTCAGNQVVFSNVDGSYAFAVKSTRNQEEIEYTHSAIELAQTGIGNTHAALCCNDTFYIGTWMLPGTNDAVVVYAGADPTPGSPTNQQFNMFCIMQINEDGTVEANSYSFWDFGLPIRWIGRIHSMCLDEDHDNIFAIGGVANLANICMYVTPYPRVKGNQEDTGININLSAELGEDAFRSNTTYQARNPNNNTAGFLVPMQNGNIRWYFLLNKVRAQFMLDNVTGDDLLEPLASSYNEGSIFYVTFDFSGAYVSGPTECSADFDQNGPPFDNDSENNDGSAIDKTDGQGYTELAYAGPANIGIRNADWVVGFHRDVSLGASNSTTGSAISFRAFRLNRDTGVFNQIRSEFIFETEDTVQTYDVSPSGRYTELDYYDWNTLFAPLSGEIFRAAQKRDGARAFDIVLRLGRARIGIADLTPPEIIREIFTNSVIGYGKSSSLIDTTTYNEAVAYCEQNGIKISVVYPSSTERITLFEALANVYGGWVAWDGYSLRFGKPTEEFVPVGVIDNDCYYQENPNDPKPPLNGKRQALQDTSNKITVKFFDRLLAYRQNEITLGDEVDQDLNGVRHKQLVTGFIMGRDTAYRLCERMLWGNMYARNIYSDVLVGWKTAKYQPGDLVTLVDSFSSTNVSARIVKKEEVGRGKFKLTLVEELDYLGKSRPLYEAPRPGVRGLPTTTERALDFDAYELPYEFQKEGPKYYVGWAPGGPSASAGLYTSPSTTDFRLYGSALPYPDAGRILSYFPETEDVIEDVLVVVNAKSGSNVNSIATWFEGEIEDYSSIDRALGLSTFRVGSELMAYEGATLVGSNVYRLDRVYRGYGGTQIQAHSAGDVWWMHQPEEGGGMFAIPYASDQIGTEFFYKVVPVGFDGVEYDPTSVPYKRFQINGDHFTPRALNANDLRILVGSGNTLPTSLANQYGPLAGTSLDYISPYYVRRVGSGPERNVLVQWPELSKTTGYGIQGYGIANYGAFQTDLDAVNWRVTVTGSGGLVVRTTTVSSPGFFYDALTNASDNGDWRGNVSFAIRPFNAYGNAPFSAVVSLNLDGT